MKNEESQLQQRCIRLFATIYPHLWDDKRIHAIPNGGHRSPQTAITLKREGTRAGVWDIQLTIPRGPYAGLWIEMKVGRNGLTDEQKAFMLSHKDDYFFAVCRSEAEFLEAIRGYLALPVKPPVGT